MKRLILLATLFLLTSCDALTGAKPKPSTTPTPVASESSDPNAPIASATTGIPGTETPGPNSNSSPSPSQMPAKPVTAGSSAIPPAPGNSAISPVLPTIVGNAELSQPAQGGVATANNGRENTKQGKVTSPNPANASSDQNSIGSFNSNLGSPNEKAQDLKVKNGKGAKGPDPSLDPSLTAINPKKSASSQTISDGGIGVAKVGMTLAELKKNLKNSAQFETQTDFTPGYNALAVKQQGKVQFYIPYPKKQKVSDKNQIKILVTDNPIYKTAEGIAPGMSIKKVTEVYGDAQLGYDPKASSEEIALFVRQPGELRFFTGGSERNGRAGIYPAKQSKEQQGFVTNKYGNSGRIKRITVICPESVCASEQQP